MRLATPNSIKRTLKFETAFYAVLIILVLIAVIGIVWVVGFLLIGIISSVGYVVMMFAGHEHTYWSGAAVGLGTLILLSVLGNLMINTVKAYRRK